MSNIAVAWANIAGNATLAASSATSTMPVTNLQQEDVSRKFRTGAVTEVAIDLTFATTQTADTFAVLGTNLTAAGFVRIRLSNVAIGNNEIWDSNPLDTPGQVDPIYEDAIVLTTPKSGWRYCRIYLVDGSLSFLEAGFLFISTRQQFSYNYDFGDQRSWIDLSETKQTRGGQTRVIGRPKLRRAEFNVGWLTAAQRWSVVEAMDIANGSNTPVLFVMDPASSNLGRDSIYGLIEVSPVASLQAFDDTGAMMFTRPYRISERL